MGFLVLGFIFMSLGVFHVHTVEHMCGVCTTVDLYDVNARRAKRKGWHVMINTLFWFTLSCGVTHKYTEQQQVKKSKLLAPQLHGVVVITA